MPKRFVFNSLLCREQLEDGGMARIGMPNDRNFYFRGVNEWPQRPRIRGMTEVRGPFSSLMAPSNLQVKTFASLVHSLVSFCM
jgi:hypothetical protein